jgi:NAD(P)H-dependent flavin oxidoreductase YrpB (nitropropane dioxygenase family)
MGISLQLENKLRLPAIAAPLFLASGPDLVVETCRAGMIGTFPALNQRTTDGFEQWLHEIKERLSVEPKAAPYGVNLIVHKTNTRLAQDLDCVVDGEPDRAQVPASPLLEQRIAELQQRSAPGHGTGSASRFSRAAALSSAG